MSGERRTAMDGNCNGKGSGLVKDLAGGTITGTGKLHNAKRSASVQRATCVPDTGTASAGTQKISIVF